MKKLTVIFLSVLLFAACENRELNEGEEFRPRQLHDNFKDSHFTKVTVDGVEYLMMERDNNNPHEGFGFMALRGNLLIEKQDTTLALLKTISEYQIQIMAHLKKQTEEDVRKDFFALYTKYLKDEEKELNRLLSDSLIAR